MQGVGQHAQPPNAVYLCVGASGARASMPLQGVGLVAVCAAAARALPGSGSEPPHTLANVQCAGGRMGGGGGALLGMGSGEPCNM